MPICLCIHPSIVTTSDTAVLQVWVGTVNKIIKILNVHDILTVNILLAHLCPTRIIFCIRKNDMVTHIVYAWFFFVYKYIIWLVFVHWFYVILWNWFKLFLLMCESCNESCLLMLNHVLYTRRQIFPGASVVYNLHFRSQINIRHNITSLTSSTVACLRLRSTTNKSSTKSRIASGIKWTRKVFWKIFPASAALIRGTVLPLLVRRWRLKKWRL